jgi:hypothetical protein
LFAIAGQDSDSVVGFSDPRVRADGDLLVTARGSVMSVPTVSGWRRRCVRTGNDTAAITKGQHRSAHPLAAQHHLIDSRARQIDIGKIDRRKDRITHRPLQIPLVAKMLVQRTRAHLRGHSQVAHRQRIDSIGRNVLVRQRHQPIPTQSASGHLVNNVH